MEGDPDVPLLREEGGFCGKGERLTWHSVYTFDRGRGFYLARRSRYMYKAVHASRLYEQIVEQIKASIREGKLKPGRAAAGKTRAGAAVWSEPNGRAVGSEDAVRERSGGGLLGTRNLCHFGSFATDAAFSGFVHEERRPGEPAVCRRDA